MNLVFLAERRERKSRRTGYKNPLACTYSLQKPLQHLAWRSAYFGTGGRTLETDDSSALQCSESRY
jgi:hypothetical protein